MNLIGLAFLLKRESTSTWGTDLRFYTHEDNTQNLTYTSERMRIDPHGNVGIGITNPGHLLAVNGTANIVGALTLGGNINKTGDLTLDSSVNIVLDADGGGVYFKDAGVNIGFLQNSGANDFRLVAGQQDKDIVFMGNDGGSSITALTLDMSEAGEATFNSDVFLKDNKNVRWGDGQDFRISFNGSNAIIYNAAANSDIVFKGNNGSQFTALTLDMSEGGAATFSSDVEIGGTNATVSRFIVNGPNASRSNLAPLLQQRHGE